MVVTNITGTPSKGAVVPIHRRQWCWDNTMSTEDSKADSSDGVRCPTCGDMFERDTAMKSHHCHIHSEDISGVTVECDNCGEVMERPPSEATGTNVCSKDCGKAVRGHESPRECRCEYCGDVCKRYASEIKEYDHQFCSDECYHAWESDHVRGGAHHNYGTGNAFDTSCAECGDTVRVTADNADHDRHFCDDGCYTAWKRANYHGQGHPNWRGGKSIYDAVKKQLQPPFSAVRDRVCADVCRNCGATDCTFHVHHIVPLMAGGTNEDWNLMTLCEPCHGTIEAYTRRLPGMEAVLTE